MADIHISDDRARSFADALQTFEKDGDAAAFAALFADDAVTQRLDARGERRGEVEQFWQEYRAQFDRSAPRSTTSSRAATGSPWSGPATPP